MREGPCAYGDPPGLALDRQRARLALIDVVVVGVFLGMVAFILFGLP